MARRPALKVGANRSDTIDYTRSQIDPEALAIIESTGHKVTPGRRDPATRDFSPNWDGLTKDDFWEPLRAKNPKGYHRLITICEEDYPTFAAVMLRVYNKTVARTHPFIFNKPQQYSWNRFARRIAAREPLFFVFLKARQFGVSTFVLGKFFWHGWRERDVRASVIAHDIPLTQTLVETLSKFFDELPDLPEIKPTLRQSNKNARVPKAEVYLRTRSGIEWRSRISTQCAKKIDARGAVAKHILFSERAFYEEAQALEDAIMPQLPARGTPARLDCSVISESTPNGQNEFYDLWQLAKQPESETEALFLPWFIADDIYAIEPPADWKISREEVALMKQLSRERINKFDGEPVTPAQMYWRRLEIDNKSGHVFDAEMAFDMEYPSDDETCFLLYQNKSVFKDDMKYLTSCISQMEDLGRKACKANAVPIGDYARGELEFEALTSPFADRVTPTRARPKFRPSAQGNLKVWEWPTPGHIYTVGSDAGDIMDNAVSQVVCVACGQQAAELTMHGEGTENFTDHSIALCRWYFNALWMPEVNHVGTIVLKRGISGWLYGNVARQEQWDELGVKKNKYGWYTNEQQKPVMVSNLISLIKDRYFRIASRELRSEMSTFDGLGVTSRGNPRFSAQSGSHDDRVMALCLALMAVRQSPRYYTEMTKKRHATLPDAVELGINETPQIERRKFNQVPDAIKEAMGDEREIMLPTNPISGIFGGLW